MLNLSQKFTFVPKESLVNSAICLLWTNTHDLIEFWWKFFAMNHFINSTFFPSLPIIFDFGNWLKCVSLSHISDISAQILFIKTSSTKAGADIVTDIRTSFAVYGLSWKSRTISRAFCLRFSKIKQQSKSFYREQNRCIGSKILFSMQANRTTHWVRYLSNAMS